MPRSRVIVACVALLFLQGCGPSPEQRKSESRPVAPARPAYANVNSRRLLAADDNAGQWMSTGRNYSEQRFSRLTKISTENVSELGLAWYSDFDTRRDQQSTPIVIDGVMYVTTAWSKVYAYDARTGAVRWKYDPVVSDEWGANSCCDVVNRGVAAWNGKVYFGTPDGRLIALNASSGKVVWSVQTTDSTKVSSIIGAPRIANGKVFIGQAGAEFGQRGYLSAYDAETGKLDWRWYGGSPWDAITYDPVSDLVIVGTGTGSGLPRAAGTHSPEGNEQLYLASMVALDAETGEYVWHYQLSPRDSGNFDGTQQITIADLYINGKQRHVAMQASKNGNFYIVNADSGKLISEQSFMPTKGFFMLSAQDGAHSWHPMSFNPQTGLVYIPALYDRPSIPALTSGGMLVAWDPVAREEVWTVEFDGARGGGTLSTAGGLVFQGNSKNQELVAYRAENGERLWSMPTQTGIDAGAVSYLVDGEQYVAVVAGAGTSGNDSARNNSRVLAFKLGGTAALPAQADVPRVSSLAERPRRSSRR